MPLIAKASVSLRIFGDDLNPEDVTRKIGKEPDQSARKGETYRYREDGTAFPPARTGKWFSRLRGEYPESDMDLLVTKLFDGMTNDLTVWQDITTKYKVDLFCGVWMAETNEGFGLSQKSLTILAERNIPLDIDVYYEGGESL